MQFLDCCAFIRLQLSPVDLLHYCYRVRAGTVASLSCNIAYLLAVILSPYMPSVAEIILTQLNVGRDEKVIKNKQFQLVLEEHFIQFLPEGHHIGKVCTSDV